MGQADSPHGAVAYAVFRVPNPAGGAPLAAWEQFFDVSDPQQHSAYADLGEQSHWHVMILGPGPKVLSVYEIENRDSLGPALAAAQAEGLGREARNLVAKWGYKPWHVFPDKAFTRHSPFLKPRFWRSVLGLR